MTIQKVRVGVDFSPASETAYRMGRWLAGIAGVPLEVVHAVVLKDAAGASPRLVVPKIRSAAQVLEDGERALRRFLARVDPTNPDVSMHVRMAGPSTAEAIIEEATEQHLIVVGASGCTDADGHLGNTATNVARKANCSVLITR